MKKVFIVIVALCISAIAFSQQEGPAISWTKVVHDFGTFKEESGKQEHSFEFVNTGSEPLYLTGVKASCGCTAVDYTKEPIQPGGKGYVKAAYDPNNRPGKFNKSITVTTNEFQPTSVLRIMGDVIPKANPNNPQ